MTRRALATTLIAAALSAAIASARPEAPKAAAPDRRPGRGPEDTLLPNGWRIAPAGRHITVGDLPLAMVESPDGRYLVIENNGYAKPTLTVVDLDRFVVLDSVPLDNAWLGLAWHPDGQAPLRVGAAPRTRPRAALEAAGG